MSVYLRSNFGSKVILAVLFAIINCFGYACSKTCSVGTWFDGKQSLAMLLVLVLLTAITFYFLVTLLFFLFDRVSETDNSEDSCWSKNPGIRSFCVIMLFRIPYILITYPGGICMDASYQVNQVLGNTPYSDQQPLVSTLLMGGFVKAGGFFGSYDLGLFSYILFQCILSSAVFAYSLYVLNRSKVNRYVKYFVLAIYALLPVYGNFTTMAVKDTLYATFSVLYITVLSQMLKLYVEGGIEVCTRLIAPYIFAAVMVTLFRSNGIYVIGLTALFFLVLVLKRKETRGNRKRSILVIFMPLIIWFVITGCLKNVLGAVEDTTREKLSVPFQQTARYIRDYPDDMSDSDRAAVEAVLDYKWYELGENYDPMCADPIKNHYRKAATRADLMNYFRAWGHGLVNHPFNYIDTYIQHIYGWLYVGTDNDTRFIGRSGIFSESLWGDENVKYWIEMIGHFPLFWLFQSAPINIWIAIIVSLYKFIRKSSDGYVVSMAFLLGVLAFCFVGPGFYEASRFAYGIVFTVPYITAYYTCRKLDESFI